jgi:hypothetical protein
MKNPAPADRTIAEVIQAFWSIHWTSWAPSSRASRHGRLTVVAASLLDDPSLARNVLALMRDKRLRHEDPTTPEGWVALYLRTHFLPTPEYTAKATAHVSSPDLEAATRWVRLHSKLANEITGEDLIRLRAQLGGSSYYTLRSYWAHVETLLNWARISGYLDHDPTIGLPVIKRKPQATRVDPDRVPSEEEIWAIANAGGDLEGEWFKVAAVGLVRCDATR